MKYICYDDCEDMVLYTGEDKAEAIRQIEEHIKEGYGEIKNVTLYEVAREIPFEITHVQVEGVEK